MEDLKAKKVGNYIHFLPNITFGSYSKIYKGIFKDGPNDKFYAIKTLDISKVQENSSKINYEIQNSKYFNDTKLITEYVEKIQTKNHLNLIYRFFQSRTMYEIINQKPSPDPCTKLKIIELTLKSLADFHAFKCIHRNLNPSHILISEDLQSLKFCGRSSIFISDKEDPSRCFGEERYQAPEVLRSGKTNEKYSDKVDIYSLGVIFYELLSGKTTTDLLDINSVSQNCLISQEMKPFLLRFLDQDPAKRSNAKDLLKNIPVSKIIDAPTIISPTEKQQPQSSPIVNNLNSLENSKKDLSGYIIKHILGEGNFGKVSLAEKKVGDKIQKYAIKEIFLSKLKSIKENELVLGEINLLLLLKNVGFVNRLYDHFILKTKYKKILYLILEYCNGGTLASYIKPKSGEIKIRNVKIDEFKIIAWNLAEGLNELHKMNIVHRDLKPENILLIKDELTQQTVEAKICDLGLSRQLAEENLNFTDCGTAIYKAPELFDPKLLQNAKLDVKVDVYSFGLILFFMVFCQHAREGMNIENYKEDFKYPETPGWCPPDLINLIKKCTAIHPNDRPLMKEVITHPFFSRIEIQNLQMDLKIFDLKNPEYSQNDFCSGFKDVVNGKYWMKLYHTNLGENQSQQIDKYIQREIDFLIKAQNISHTVKLEKFGRIEEKNSIAIIFEYIEYSLNRLVFIRSDDSTGKSSYPNFSTEEIKCVARCGIEFLNELHGKNFFHRKILPKHILVVVDSSLIIKEIKFCGFEASKSDNLDKDVSTCFNKEEICYTDPSIFDQGFYESSDLWSLGIVIYFMLFGDVPAKEISEIKTIKDSGVINYPQDKQIDDEIKKFITFCIKKSGHKSKSKINLKEEIIKEDIHIF